MGTQPRTGPIKVLVADDNEKARDALIEQLRFEDVQVVGESSLGTAAYTWAAHLDVDVVLVTVNQPLARSLQTVESLAVGARTWPVVALSSLGDRETMRKAMMAGARDYVVTPTSGLELHRTIVEVHAVDQHRRAAAASGQSAMRLGTIIAVFGVKGGIGKSTVATNVAVSLAQQTSQHVALLDLDLQFGDSAVLLDIVPAQTIADAARDIERMDPQLITGYLSHHASKLRLLAAPPTPDDADGITGETVGQVLEALAATNDYVVVDLSPRFDDVSMVALDLATIVLVPVLPEVTCIRRTRGAMVLMKQWGYTDDKVKLIVNRARRKSEVSLAEIQEVLAAEVYAEIPEDSAVGKANALGTPVAMSGPKTKAGRAILELCRSLAGLPKPQRRLFTRRDAVPVSQSLTRRIAESAAPAAPSLANWARIQNGDVAAAQPPAAPAYGPGTNGHYQGSNGYTNGNGIGHGDAAFGSLDAQQRIWANLIGPMVPAQDGAVPTVPAGSPWPPPVAPVAVGAGHGPTHPNGSDD